MRHDLSHHSSNSVQLAEVQIVVTRPDKGWSINTLLQRGMILADGFCSWSHKSHRSTAQGGAGHDVQADQPSNIYHELSGGKK
jgi:hypothetical protein